MNKLSALRTHMLSFQDDVAIDPKNLITLAQRGSIESYRDETRNNGFGWKYTAEIIVTDFSGDANKLVYLLLLWLDEHEPNHPPEAFDFEAEILNAHSTDLSFTIPLTDTVQAIEGEDGITLHPYTEPLLDDSVDATLTDLWVNDIPVD